MKIGVVIQGPINSGGFDSTSTIKKTVEEYLRQPSVTHIVISIWKGEKFTYSHPRVTVLRNTPPLGRDVNNRRRQWFSTLQGIRRLEKLPLITHVLKVRTDEYVPSAAIEYMESFYSAKNLKKYKEAPDWRSEIFLEPLLFSFANRTFPFFIGDFYFGGHVEDMKRLLENGLAFEEHIFQRIPEADMVLKHLFLTDSNFPLTRKNRYFPVRKLLREPLSHPIWHYWHLIHGLYFASFPKSVFSKVTWRGMRWVDFQDKRIGKTGSAQQIVDTYYDFASHWQLLHRDPKSYKELPRIDPSISTRLEKREWLDLARGIMESFFR